MNVSEDGSHHLKSHVPSRLLFVTESAGESETLDDELLFPNPGYGRVADDLTMRLLRIQRTLS